MKKIRLIPLFFGLALTLCTFTNKAYALPFLPFPNANQLTGPVFIQPSAGLAVVSESGGIGRTESFFSDLPDGSLPGNFVVNILGNFQAFDQNGNPTPFNIVGVEVTVGSSTFMPPFGPFDFGGNPSVTFVDSLDFDTVTFFAQNPTFSFTFNAGSNLAFSYTLFTTGLSVGSLVTYDDVEVSVPEPASLLLLGSGLAGLRLVAKKRQRRK